MNLSYSSQQTTDGGYIVGGRSDSNASFDKSENSKGNFDYWIIKTEASGNLSWDKTIGAGSPQDFNGQDVFRKIIQTADGDYLICGYSNAPASGDKTENAVDESDDFWIVKISAVGIIEWQNTIGGNDTDEPFAAIQTQDGGYVVGGTSFSSISGDKTQDSRGFSDIWLLKLGESGQILWQHTYGGSGYDGMVAVVESANGNLTVGGSSDSPISGDKTEPSRGLSDFWLLQLNGSGDIIWQKTIGGNANESLRAVVKSSDGGFLVAGYSDSGVSGDKTTPTQGGSDFWIVSISETGEILWQNSFGGSGTDSLFAANICSDGGYILTGTSDSPISGDKTNGVSGIRDSWTIKINSNGILLWQKTLGGNADDGFNSVQQTSDGGFVLSGGTNSAVSGDVSNGPKGVFDYWIVKLNPENLSDKNFTKSSIIAYPNPTTGTLRIALGEIKSSVSVKITDALGKTINGQAYINTDLITLDIDGAAGFYFVQVDNGNDIFFFKVLKI